MQHEIAKAEGILLVLKIQRAHMKLSVDVGVTACVCSLCKHYLLCRGHLVLKTPLARMKLSVAVGVLKKSACLHEIECRCCLCVCVRGGMWCLKIHFFLFA